MRSIRRIVVAVLLAACSPALGARDINADVYLDRLRGMWLGQILGNYAGRDTEGAYGIRGGNPAQDIDWNSFINTTPWNGDDDTVLEYMYMNLLAKNPSPTNADIKTAWETHVPLPSFYIANKQASWLMAEGLAPPRTGSIHKNMHWYAIDSQITTESIGAVAPGLRQRSADLVGQLGSTTNDGYAVHAAQFYAAMYAAAAFESDVEALVASGLEVVPTTSRTYQVIQDVRDWYAADKADGSVDWRSTQEKIYDKYVGLDSKGRYRYWIESTVNTGMTTLAILYGQGDFKETVKVGVLAGFDCDCNPATAGGLIGLVQGYSNLPGDLTSAASDDYYVETLVNITRNTTVSQVAVDFRSAVEQQVIAAGGTIDGQGAARTYHLPDADNVSPPPERPDPSGPGGLVGQVLADGGAVSVSASLELHNPNKDRENLDNIIDGITDVSYNGHLPYWTRDGADPQPAGGDYYQIEFDRVLAFRSVVFHEGDILWNGINGNPKDDEPKGGYFLDIIVEVGRDGVFTKVDGLQMSEPLDAYEYFQRIELEFDPVFGDSIRIRGQAGGTEEFTSIVELEAYGPAPGDANLDNMVDISDLGILAGNWDLTSGATWLQGDFDGDGVVSVGDLGILAGNWGDARPAVPEPATLALLSLGGMICFFRSARPTPL